MVCLLGPSSIVTLQLDPLSVCSNTTWGSEEVLPHLECSEAVFSQLKLSGAVTNTTMNVLEARFQIQVKVYTYAGRAGGLRVEP